MLRRKKERHEETTSTCYQHSQKVLPSPRHLEPPPKLSCRHPYRLRSPSSRYSFCIFLQARAQSEPAVTLPSTDLTSGTSKLFLRCSPSFRSIARFSSAFFLVLGYPSVQHRTHAYISHEHYHDSQPESSIFSSLEVHSLGADALTRPSPPSLLSLGPRDFTTPHSIGNDKTPETPEPGTPDSQELRHLTVRTRAHQNRPAALL